jgi:hypothetical protein
MVEVVLVHLVLGERAILVDLMEILVDQVADQALLFALEQYFARLAVVAAEVARLGMQMVQMRLLQLVVLAEQRLVMV